MFPWTSSFAFGLFVPIPTFHQILKIFVSFNIHANQFRYGVAHRVHASKNHAGHCGHVAQAGHCGHVAQAGHCGHVAQAGHCGHVSHTGHCGHVSHTGHCGHVSHTGHCGHVAQTGHCGHVAQTGHCGHVAHVVPIGREFPQMSLIHNALKLPVPFTSTAYIDDEEGVPIRSPAPIFGI